MAQKGTKPQSLALSNRLAGSGPLHPHPFFCLFLCLPAHAAHRQGGWLGEAGRPQAVSGSPSTSPRTAELPLPSPGLRAATRASLRVFQRVSAPLHMTFPLPARPSTGLQCHLLRDAFPLAPCLLPFVPCQFSPHCPVRSLRPSSASAEASLHGQHAHHAWFLPHEPIR